MLNIALVTNKKLHHKFWSSQLYENHNVKLIIHPSSKSKNLKDKIFGSKNFLWSVLKILSIFYNKFSSSSFSKQLERGQESYFKEYEKEYLKIDKHIIHNVNSVNDPSTIQLFKNNNIDVICFLGGDIVKKIFFDSLDALCLNFHSGISPFYNGNKTVFQAVSDFRPNFAGGTLMKMNEKLDGGAILSHYLTPIRKKDNAADLFLKGIIGSVKLYSDALSNIDLVKNGGVTQERSFKYVRNLDWTILNDVRLNNFYKSNKLKIYIREEEILLYYNVNNIQELYSKSLFKILGKSKKNAK
jgi:folate-dependent phosphoribosylglycinamide formyltransferase PurN